MSKLAAPAVLLIVSLLGAPASAGPLGVTADRSDNTYYFEYDPSSGQIGQESSALIHKRSDPVAYFVYVREAADAADGQRLSAKFGLTLNSERARQYKGSFWLVVRDDTGTVVLRKRLRRNVLLRPRAGERRERFSMAFDLPAPGLNYEAKGLFRSN